VNNTTPYTPPGDGGGRSPSATWPPEPDPWVIPYGGDFEARDWRGIATVTVDDMEGTPDDIHLTVWLSPRAGRGPYLCLRVLPQAAIDLADALFDAALKRGGVA
jgi:hypothetical protein